MALDLTAHIGEKLENAENIYLAVIGEENCLAYVPDPSMKTMRGRSVASIKLLGRDEELELMAPYGVELYEPQIRELIKNIDTLECRFEKSCGAVVYLMKGQKPYYFIIENRHHNWGFPKGHVEKGEDEIATALREVFEETGLTPKIKDGFRESVSYYVREHVHKTAVYFAAESDREDVILPTGEISSCRLLPIKQALSQLTYPSEKSLLKKADAFLTGRRSRS